MRKAEFSRPLIALCILICCAVLLVGCLGAPDGDPACIACTDQNADERCDVCGKALAHTVCIDTDRNALCDKCGAHLECTEHLDEDENTHCDVCGEYMPCSTCSDNNEDGYCDRCLTALECMQHKDTDRNLICDICGDAVECTLHEDVDDNGSCDACGIRLACTTHRDADLNAYCDRCGEFVPCEVCVDVYPRDLVCDICRTAVPCTQHRDEAPIDLACDLCGEYVACPHPDESPKNAICDRCGARLECECTDEAPRDAKCDVCGREMPCEVCADLDKNAKCDVCGREVPCKECVDNDADIKCDVCAKEIPCETCADIDPRDARCDRCNKFIPCDVCIDLLPRNYRCDVCGGYVPCTDHVDNNLDYNCDFCHEPLQIPEGLMLIDNKEARFRFVISSSATSSGVVKAVEDIILRLSEFGISTEWVRDEVANASGCEVLIGSMENRGEQYKYDCRSLGYSGYTYFEKDGNVQILGGSDEALCTAILHFSENVLGLGDGTKYLSYAIMSEDVDMRQTEYQISSITLNGKDISDFVITVDKSSVTSYRLAKDIQINIYKCAGLWLEICEPGRTERAIILESLPRLGKLCYALSVGEDTLKFSSEFTVRMEQEARAFFDENVFAVTGEVSLGYQHAATRDFETVYYSDFGAVGDGVTDDFFAIKACHDYANSGGHTVCADQGAVYYIGDANRIDGSQIIIQTDTHWDGAEFIIDDSIIQPDDSYYALQLFLVTSDRSPYGVPQVFTAGGIKKGVEKLPWQPGETVLLHIVNKTVKHFIRYGGNADEGQYQQEILLVHPDGSIDRYTPLQWDYDEISSAVAYPVTDLPITVSGGKIKTIANQGPNEYKYYGRGISIMRSNVTFDGIKHSLVDELDHRSPYSGFTSTRYANNVIFKNMQFQHHENRYTDKSSTGQRVLLGTYEISARLSNDIHWINCNQTNFFEPNGSTTSRGLMGTNYCKNLNFDGCTLSSFDAHCGTYNATLKNSSCEHINFIGEGTITLENMTMYSDASRAGLNLRDDYGSTWQGDLVIKGMTMKYSSASPTLTLVSVGFHNHFFGYQTYLPKNIYIDDLRVSRIKYSIVNGERVEENIGDNLIDLHLYRSLESYKSVDISNPEAIYPVYSGEVILNPYMPTENVYITGSPGLRMIYPNTPQFAKMRVYVNGEEINWKQ